MTHVCSEYIVFSADRPRRGYFLPHHAEFFVLFGFLPSLQNDESNLQPEDEPRSAGLVVSYLGASVSGVPGLCSRTPQNVSGEPLFCFCSGMQKRQPTVRWFTRTTSPLAAHLSSLSNNKRTNQTLAHRRRHQSLTVLLRRFVQLAHRGGESVESNVHCTQVYSSREGSVLSAQGDEKAARSAKGVSDCCWCILHKRPPTRLLGSTHGV